MIGQALYNKSDHRSQFTDYIFKVRLRRFDSPRPAFRCVQTFSLIVLHKSGHEVARYTTVMRFFVSFADEDVDVVESVHQTA